MIHIYYLQTSHNKQNPFRPEWFDYERCFKNLLDTKPQSSKITVVFDGKISEFNNHFTFKYLSSAKICANFYFKIIGDRDIKSPYTELIHVIKNDEQEIKNHDLIMIQENDYLFANNWGEYAEDLNNLLRGDHYISLYDHPDKYMFNIPDAPDPWNIYVNLTSKIITSNFCHWRTVPSTCGSFLLSKKLFLEDFDIHTNDKADNSRFGFLTKNRNRAVLTPIPSLSTHCVNPYLAPFVDWKTINNNTKI